MLQSKHLFYVMMIKLVAGTEFAWFNETSKGILLRNDPTDENNQLENVTICFKFSLSDGQSHCLFDIASLQFLYLHPFYPGYGILRIKTEEDKTVVFSPNQPFEMKKLYQVCLRIVVGEGRSHLTIFWNGKKILEEALSNEEKMKCSEIS